MTKEKTEKKVDGIPGVVDRKPSLTRAIYSEHPLHVKYASPVENSRVVPHETGDGTTLPVSGNN